MIHLKDRRFYELTEDTKLEVAVPGIKLGIFEHEMFRAVVLEQSAGHMFVKINLKCSVDGVN